MTDSHRQVGRGLAVDLLEFTPDWVLLAIIVLVLGGWLGWIVASAYRLFF
jgi:hypothetical protein